MLTPKRLRLCACRTSLGCVRNCVLSVQLTVSAVYSAVHISQPRHGMSTDCTGSNLDAGDEQSLVLVQVTTIKRVIMESEKLRALLKELGQTRDQGRNADHLLWLISRLQRIQALGPPASRARLLSEEVSRVARLVTKYLERTASASPVSGCSAAQTTPESVSYERCQGCQSSSWRSFYETSKGGDLRTLTLVCRHCGRSIVFKLA